MSGCASVNTGEIQTVFAGRHYSAIPEELEHTETIASLGKVTIRPIKPDDAPVLGQLVRDLAPEDSIDQ